ncbi:hypothetical protein [Hallella sp.]|uniref:hypothetical protein n=1 Tax=Hallella sp. TaxID=2980186 RepID=UPI0030794D90
MNVENESLQHRRRDEDAPKNNHLRLRNVLNVIFMLLAIVGGAVYYWSDQIVGAIIIMVAVVFKLVESAIRIMFR